MFVVACEAHQALHNKEACGALAGIEHHGLLDAQLLNDIVYNKELPTGFAHLFAKANHLVTSRGKLSRTENLNLNFTFRNPNDTDIYEHVYLGLAYLLFYAMLLQAALFSRMKSVEPSFVRWMTLSSMVSFHALFITGPNPIVTAFNKSLSDFLVCPHCKAKVKITKASAQPGKAQQRTLVSSLGLNTLSLDHKTRRRLQRRDLHVGADATNSTGATQNLQVNASRPT